MNNAEWMIKNGYKFSDVCLKGSYDAIAIFVNGKNLGKVRGTYSTAFQKWLDMEHKEPILDDAERRYLLAVIKPFRESVKNIKKSDIYRDEAICIDTEKRYMVFPPFKAGTMYKGMKLNKLYTLEELGL